MLENRGARNMKGIGVGILVILGFLALGWVIQGNNFFLYKAFAPKYEQVRRETFEQSKAFNQGMIQELQNMQFEYVRANDEQKTALADIILHRVADFDLNQPQVPADLRTFVVELKQKRLSVQ